ncbi:TolC family protein, partial [Alienimonas chondri]|uniref:TolC family protein n=1 Tax=Alienimonas chondri TaxID=2681879 RepID=UPI0014884CD3
MSAIRPAPADRISTAAARRWRRALGTLCLAGLTTTGVGCTTVDALRLRGADRNVALEQVPQAPRVPDVIPAAATEHDPRGTLGFKPRTIRDADAPVEHWEISLQEAIAFAVENSTVARDLGAAVLRNPDSVRTRFDPALQYTDARFGPEAALAAFDAEFTSSLLAQNNDRIINNQFAGGGVQQFQQDLLTSQSELRKRTATGSAFALRQFTEYDKNNAPANLFRSAYENYVEAEARQPLLRGGGVTFNRLAGPNGEPGFYNGVVIARVNHEISQTEFETGLRDFVSDVTNAYWELTYAYRNLNAKRQARDRAMVVAEAFRDRAEGLGGSDAEKEALVREQYFRFQEEVEEALAGRPIEYTFTGAGRGGGTFRGGGGVQTADRRLRLLMGVPLNDDRVLRPLDDGPAVPPEIVFDWGAIATRALDVRPELRTQRLRVRRAEMELEASKNFLSPQLDAIARYRVRGFGDRLVSAADGPPGPQIPGSEAFETLSSGDFQEWEVGMEFSMPLGFRRAHAAVQNAELKIARERALLREQERQVMYDLSNAVAEKDRAYQSLQTSLNRHAAALELLDSLENRFGLARPSVEGAGAEAAAAGGVGEFGELDRLLDAQRRVTDSELAVFRARASYEVAIKNVFFETGELLQYHEVLLSDGGASGPGVSAPGGLIAPPAPAPAPRPDVL